MTLRLAVLLLGAAALAQPPVAANVRILTIPACGGGEAHHRLVPADPADPAKGPDCAKACHAVADRRAKPGAAKRPCC